MDKVSDEGVRLRFDHAELSPPDRRFTAWRWWDVYLEAAARLVPDVIATLLTPDGLNAATDSEAGAAFLDNDRGRHIRAWCQRWGFHTYYAQNPAWNTINAAIDARNDGAPFPDTFVCSSTGEYYRRFRADTDRGLVVGVNHPDGDQPHPFPELSGRVISGNSWNSTTRGLEAMSPKLLNDMGTQVVVDVPTLFWEPTAETRAEARARILEIIGEILDRDLDTIVQAYRAHGYTDPPVKRQSEHVEWLVRYQILGESRRKIARTLADARQARDADWTYDLDTYKSHVGREIKAVAEGLGLTLRDDAEATQR